MKKEVLGETKLVMGFNSLESNNSRSSDGLVYRAGRRRLGSCLFVTVVGYFREIEVDFNYNFTILDRGASVLLNGFLDGESMFNVRRGSRFSANYMYKIIFAKGEYRKKKVCIEITIQTNILNEN